MRLFKDLIRRYFREYFFLLTTIPVAMVLFGMVQFGFGQAPLPLSVLLALAILTVMQWVAKSNMQLAAEHLLAPDSDIFSVELV